MDRSSRVTKRSAEPPGTDPERPVLRPVRWRWRMGFETGCDGARGVARGWRRDANSLFARIRIGARARDRARAPEERRFGNALFVRTRVAGGSPGHRARGRSRSARGRCEPVGSEPGEFDFERFTAVIEGAERGAAYGCQVSPPATVGVRLDTTRATDPEPAKGGEVDRLGVHRADATTGVDDQFHHASPEEEVCLKIRR